MPAAAVPAVAGYSVDGKHAGRRRHAAVDVLTSLMAETLWRFCPLIAYDRIFFFCFPVSTRFDYQRFCLVLR